MHTAVLRSLYLNTQTVPNLYNTKIHASTIYTEAVNVFCLKNGGEFHYSPSQVLNSTLAQLTQQRL